MERICEIRVVKESDQRFRAFYVKDSIPSEIKKHLVDARLVSHSIVQGGMLWVSVTDPSIWKTTQVKIAALIQEFLYLLEPEVALVEVRGTGNCDSYRWNDDPSHFIKVSKLPTLPSEPGSPFNKTWRAEEILS